MKSWAGLANLFITFVSGVVAGSLLTVIFVVISQDPGRAWGQLWESVGLPAWLLVFALIFTLIGTRSRRGRKEDGEA